MASKPGGIYGSSLGLRQPPSWWFSRFPFLVQEKSAPPKKICKEPDRRERGCLYSISRLQKVRCEVMAVDVGVISAMVSSIGLGVSLGWARRNSGLKASNWKHACFGFSFFGEGGRGGAK